MRDAIHTVAAMRKRRDTEGVDNVTTTTRRRRRWRRWRRQVLVLPSQERVSSASRTHLNRCRLTRNLGDNRRDLPSLRLYNRQTDGRTLDVVVGQSMEQSDLTWHERGGGSVLRAPPPTSPGVLVRFSAPIGRRTPLTGSYTHARTCSGLRHQFLRSFPVTWRVASSHHIRSGALQ